MPSCQDCLVVLSGRRGHSCDICLVVVPRAAAGGVDMHDKQADAHLKPEVQGESALVHERALCLQRRAATSWLVNGGRSGRREVCAIVGADLTKLSGTE